MKQSCPLFPELSFGSDRSPIRLNEAVCAVARRNWPVKTAANLASRAKVQLRTAELWLEGRNDISGRAIVELMRCDIGYEIMQAIMQGSKTRWWQDFQRGVKISEIEKKNEWLSAQIAALKA